MKRFRKNFIIVLACLLPACVPAHAAEPEAIYVHNQEMLIQWVNWRPASWEQSEEIQTLAGRLLREAGSRKTVPRRIHDWICANISYDWEALERETYSALLPSEVLLEREAVCEGVANLTQVLFLEAGIPCIKVWGVTIAEGTDWADSGLNLTRANHTWNEAYINSRWVTLDCTMDIINGTDSYFDPDENFFAQTHKRLRRGDDLTVDSPSAWAIPEITSAVNFGLIPLDWLTHYHSAVTAEEWFGLTGLGDPLDIPLTRKAAAMSLAAVLEAEGTPISYFDVQDCSIEEQKILSALYTSGIMTGYKGYFCPNAPLTRQSAIAVLSRLHNYMEG